MPERSHFLHEDPFRVRRPTSHERMTGQPWDASYRDGPAPWDIGRPQPAIVRLASENRLVGPVLDAGCGTGENTLFIASLGVPVLGVDVAETALAMAREKSRSRAIAAEFATADAFELARLNRRFQTVLDCGLFHTFEADEHTQYVKSLAAVIEPDGLLYVLCFSDAGPEIGPHPVRQEELHTAFSAGNGWQIATIRPERIETRYHDNDVSAWLVTVKRM
jgi:SAM-dependent methyltransferase